MNALWSQTPSTPSPEREIRIAHIVQYFREKLVRVERFASVARAGPFRVAFQMNERAFTWYISIEGGEPQCGLGPVATPTVVWRSSVQALVAAFTEGVMPAEVQLEGDVGLFKQFLLLLGAP